MYMSQLVGSCTGGWTLCNREDWQGWGKKMFIDLEELYALEVGGFRVF